MALVRRCIALAALLVSLAPLTWVATGLVAGWLAARRGKSWCWGFVLGFCFSTAGVALAALPRRSGPRALRKDRPSPVQAGAAAALTARDEPVPPESATAGQA